MKKRTWHYAQNPKDYCIHCDICGGQNIEWSEFEKKIWCYDCKKDTHGDEGIFDGPIPLEAASMMGIRFDIYDMKNKKIISFHSKEWDEVAFDGYTITDMDDPRRPEYVKRFKNACQRAGLVPVFSDDKLSEMWEASTFGYGVYDTIKREQKKLLEKE